MLLLKARDYLKQSECLEQLIDLGYIRVGMVLELGDFSQRGNIIDIYPQSYSNPIRIEFFDNKIDRLNTFDISSQRSLSACDQVEIKILTQQRKTLNLDEAIAPDLSLLSHIKSGDAVVHEAHGVGIFKGLVQKDFSNEKREFIEIHYKDQDRLFVPVMHIDRIHAFSAGDRKPIVNGLYDGSWGRATARAKRELKALAEDIYYTQQARLQLKGFAFDEDNAAQLEMEAAFEYSETPDQLAAIADIKADMQSDQPMDRVLCGDVGFGKTEVILRAAFKATQSLKQVVVLVPTTILAEQHYKTFKKRFEAYAIEVAALSRFKSVEEKKAIIAGLASHQIDIVIGTHRLLQKDIVLKELGLIIVDEEQRFGVRHKEKLKALKQHVDVLSVSATPIPRTLYMALTGSRTFSTLATPPKGRKPIHTTVGVFEQGLVKAAIQRELGRGGQVFYLFNNIADIDQKASQLRKLIPDLRIEVAHARLSPKNLERLMQDFYAHQYDVLLCTTIIENGLDVPNVNTIIIERAESLGLSQIHQIRGRVGRGIRDSYALVLASNQALSQDSKKRLEALKEYVALGSGYRLALKDLEIRGAGSLLGEKQHGHMTNIGFDLYCKLLKDALAERKGESVQEGPLLDTLGIKLYIPDDYVVDERERYTLYQKLLSVKDINLLEDLEDACIDRYGKLPSNLAAVFNSLKNVLLSS